MKITMVKKKLVNGQACEKGIQSEKKLRDKGVWEKINEVVWADENDPNSIGHVLAAKHSVSIAPFFIVLEDNGAETVYKSTLRFLKDLFDEKKTVSPSSVSSIDDQEISVLVEHFEAQEPQYILKWALARFGQRAAIAFSGAEDVVLIDMAVQLQLDFSVFCLDTGRLHPETYAFIEKVRKHYQIDIALMSPLSEPLQAFVKEKGLFSFYEDGHKECCQIRKVEPLRRALQGYSAWITGQRQDQSPTRNTLKTIEIDRSSSTPVKQVLKLNPLSFWKSFQVWSYIVANDVPFNELHLQGFKSIGCQPCTRPTHQGEHERAGRWWWEESTRRECGLHIT